MSRFILKSLCLSAFVFSGSAWAHTTCSASDLKQKSCILQLGHLNVQISPQKITWNDHKWTSLADFPFQKEQKEGATEWEKIQLRQLNGRWILEMWLWGPPKGEAKVESLHWIVSEIFEKKFKVFVDESVRVRRPVAGATDTYDYDPFLPYGLKWDHHQIHWKAANKKGEF